MAGELDDRSAFAERLRTQLQSRYRGITVTVEGDRFAVRLTAAGIDTRLPLEPLHHDVLGHPDRAAALIGAWVASVERQLAPRPASGLSTARMLWCVRARSYLEGLSRADELLVTPAGTDMVGFLAEALPGSVMRGIPRAEWEGAALDEASVRAAADRNTAQRFATTAERLRATERVARDGWRLTGDLLFQGSAVLVPDVRRALVDHARGEVLLAIPDRTVVLALPLTPEAVQPFRHRVNRTFREAMTPCSRELLVSDGSTLAAYDTSGSRRRGTGLMGWLRD